MSAEYSLGMLLLDTHGSCKGGRSIAILMQIRSYAYIH